MESKHLRKIYQIEKTLFSLFFRPTFEQFRPTFEQFRPTFEQFRPTFEQLLYQTKSRGHFRVRYN